MASSAATARPPARLRTVWRPTSRFARTWPYLIPALFFFVGWQLWPILRALWISFTSFSFLLDDSPESANWIWFHNYVDAPARPARAHRALARRDLHRDLPAGDGLPADGDRGARRPRAQPEARDDLPADPADPGDDPGPADLHPLGVDVLERDRADQLRPRRRPPRLRHHEPADVARLDEHSPSSRSR